MTAGWDDPVFVPLVLGGSLVSLVAFLGFALPMTALAAWEPPWAAAWRIQKRRPDVRRWLGPSVARFVVNNLVLTTLLVASWPLWGHLVRVRVGGWPGAWELLGSVVLFVYLDDVAYWFMHRALHAKGLYERVHVVHHRVVTPCAITGHYMHPVEYALTGGLMLLWPLLFGSHVVTVYTWIVLRQWEAAEGHAGYRLPLGLTHLLPGSRGAEPHDRHHAKVRGNYSGFLGWFDRVMGTELT